MIKEIMEWLGFGPSKCICEHKPHIGRCTKASTRMVRSVFHYFVCDCPGDEEVTK